MTSNAKRPVFLEDDGLASVSDMESPGYSGKIAVFSARSGGRSSSFRVFSPRSPGVSSSSSSSSLRPFPAAFYDARCDENRHFLDSCHLCKKPIPEWHDIYMYRGDIPFCSEACRQEQIEMDEAEEKNNRSLSMKASARKDAQKSTSTHGGKQRMHVRAGTVVAG